MSKKLDPEKKVKLPLSKTHPDLAKQAVGWDPSTVTFGSHLRKLWTCDQAHEYEASVRARASNKSGCPLCSPRALHTGVNDLATLSPRIASEAYGWDPSMILSQASSSLDWKCSEGHIWSADVYNRFAGAGCPYCTRKYVLQGENDLATEHPELVGECDGWDATKFFSGSNKKKPWVCQLGHRWSAAILERALNGTGCPICSNQKILIGFNDLQTVYPEIAREAFEWDSTKVNGGSKAKKQWKCSLGHIWKAQIINRTRGNQGCPYCTNRIVLEGFNDLQTLFPEIAKEANGWDPSKVLAGSHKKCNWKCREGHSWTASVGGRSGTKRSGCPSCSKTGFDPNKDAWIYFARHSDFDLLQIGITNNPQTRIKFHQKFNWEIIEIRGPMDGHLTQQWETAILKMLRVKGAIMGRRKENIYKENKSLSKKNLLGTEIWINSSFPVKSIKELMQLTEEFEEENKELQEGNL